MNTGQASAASNPPFPPTIPSMSYQQPTYANHPVSVIPPGTLYSMGGMPGGQQNLPYRMLTGLPSATAGHGGPLGSGPAIPVGVGRAGAMPMTVTGQPQGPGMSMRYAPPQMGIGRGMPNGMVQNSLGRGIGMPGMRVAYTTRMSDLPPGTRVVPAPPGGMAAHPGYTLVNQHGQPVSYQMSQSQQQHANPNGPGGPGPPPAHMLPQQPQPGGPPQQPPPLGGPGTTHPGGQGQKLYPQQQTFMTSGPMGALPPPNGGSPVRNPSPSAVTPANAQTPGGPGAGRGMINPPTPANASTPFASANAATPGPRPGTASGQTNPTGFTQHTPRMTAADAMAGAGLQSSPGTMQRNPSTNMGMQQQQQQQAHLSQQGGAQPQPGGPGGPGSAMDHSALYRPTPAQMENHRNMQIYGQSQGPMEDVRFTAMGMGATPGQLAQQDQQRQQRPMMIPPQGIPGPIQPQLTGGSMSGQAGPGARPLVPQQTGGSIQDSAMNGPGNTASGPGGRTSVPSTPQAASRQASISMGAPPGMMRPGSVPAMQGHPTGAEMAPPPPRNEGFRSLPMELGSVSAHTMPHDGMTGGGTSRHAFGVLRLLQLSSQMRHLAGYDTEKWSAILEEHFTENAIMSFRAQKNTGQPTNTFVHLPFPLLARFFTTLTQSNIYRMSLILDGAIESQEGQTYTVFCAKARWPMYYTNGYIMELNGVLRARCKTVPVHLPALDTGIPAGAPGSTPRMVSAVPAGNTNGMGSSPSSSNNMQASPTSKPNTGNLSYGPETKPYIPMQNVAYMVKIDELSFDSESVERFVDAVHIRNPPSEPDNVFGVPKLTMRMLEFCEGSQALGPLIDFTRVRQNTGPLNALEEYSAEYEQHGPPAGPPREPYVEEYYTLLPGQRGGMMKNGKGFINEMLQSGMLPKGPIGYDDLNSGSSPSTLSANVIQPMGEFTEPSSGTSDPTVSPPLATKTPGKKNTGPGSPTKGTANGAIDKDKGGGKRKNTNDAEGPSKRRQTRKSSKVN